MSITPAAAISEGGLLADAFRGPSWDRWRAVLRAAYAEPLTADDLALFREVAERDPPAQRVRELWCIVGRRGGKDSIASAIAAAAALGDYRGFLRPGERATVMCLAVDRDQARIVHRYVVAYFAGTPQLAPLVERETDDGLELRNGVEIVIGTSNYRAPRGRTIVCVIMDEVAFWRSEESASPDEEVHAAVVPAMATIPGAILVGISTAYRRKGLAFGTWRRSYGQDDPDVLVVRGTSRQFNETLDQRIVDRALERDPEAAAAEWLSEWRSDLSDFLDRELVEGAVDTGVIVRPPQPGVAYFAFADPSGGRGSSFTAAIAHAEGQRVVLDALYERRAPFEPTETVAEVADLLRAYGLAEIVGDKYAAEWVIDSFAKVGARYVASERDRSRIYLGLLPLFTSGRAALLDNYRATHQFISLERRIGRGGREAVSAPPGGKDDLANAIAGALVLAASEARPSLIRRAAMLKDNAPVPMPSFAEAVFSTLIVGSDGMAAIAYFATHNHRVADPAPLALVDISLCALSGSTVTAMFTRLEELHRAIRGVRARGAFVPTAYLLHVHLEGFTAEEFPDDLMRDLPKLALSAAGHVNAGRFKLAEPAYEKAAHLPLAGALSFRAGEPIDASPLRLAILAGIALALTPGSAEDAPMIPAARFA